LKNNNNIEITEKLINKKVVDANLKFTIYLFGIKVYKVCLIEVYKTIKKITKKLYLLGNN